jgi:sugar phosphate isomerase/epimerase
MLTNEPPRNPRSSPASSEECTRRGFLRAAALLASAATLGSLPGCAGRAGGAAALGEPGSSSGTGRFAPALTLAQWSLHRAIFGGRLDPLDFPRAARALGLDGVEYVNQFYVSHAAGWAEELRRRSDGEGIRSHLIMCDGEGDLGSPSREERRQAVSRHARWLEAAHTLGCHSIRVNARSTGEPDAQRGYLVDGLQSLCEAADRHGLFVLVENHGGQSSDGFWLAGVLRSVGHARIGSLPDFGNFRRTATAWEDRYAGVEQLLPMAKALSAKSYDFDAAGSETTIDYLRMLRLARHTGYSGAIGIEYEGRRLSEADGILATKRLLLASLDTINSEQPRSA